MNKIRIKTKINPSKSRLQSQVINNGAYTTRLKKMRTSLRKGGSFISGSDILGLDSAQSFPREPNVYQPNRNAVKQLLNNDSYLTQRDEMFI